jgi:glycosyltransferase involved in cell wall biosynthesis
VGLSLRVGDAVRPVERARLPRRDAFDALRPGDPARPHAYRSGFVAVARVEPVSEAQRVELTLELELASGARSTAPVGAVELVPRLEAPRETAAPRLPGGGPAVAICMATHEPRPELLRRQLDSIRAQTHRNWVCLISDDRSGPEGLRAIREQIEGDERFALAPSGTRLGFYANFERALSMAPAEAEFVALADQDDLWHPDKLERLLAGIGSAQLAYSDSRVVAPSGEVLRESYWSERRNNWTSFASLLLANTVSGASLLCRREVLDDALPFPPAVGAPFHDHWLACVALARGELAYVDAQLYDYVQHGDAAIGHAHANRPRGGLSGAARQVRVDRGREIYFHSWLQLRLFAEVLALRLGERMTRSKRRALRLVATADSAPAGIPWLVGRRARRLFGRDETLDRELHYAFGLLTRRAISASALGLERPTPLLLGDARAPRRDETA